MTIFIETHCVIQSDTHPLLVTTQFIFEIESYYKGIQGAMTVEDFFQVQVLSHVRNTLNNQACFISTYNKHRHF